MQSCFRRRSLLVILSMCSVLFSACSAFSPSPAPTSPLPTVAAPASQTGKFELSSNAFADGGTIPRHFTCDAESVSPPLAWRGAPPQTKSYVLIVDDPDAPSGTFTHWVVFDIPGNVVDAQEATKTLGKDAKNGRGQTGYTGPCPPTGTHRYFFTLYALDTPTLGLDVGSTRTQVENAMQNHILAKAVLLGKYSR